MKVLRHLHGFRHGESGQILPMFVMLMIAICAMAGLATDLGRIYVARAQLGRSVDAAALAGAKQLPNISLADAKARAFIATNESDATTNVNVYPDVPSQQVEVSATRTVHTFFMRLVGIDTVQVSNRATAGFGISSLDAYATLDATGSMHQGCDVNETVGGGACPIKEARDGATNFVNTLLSDNDTSGITLIGMGAFRGCYNPPRSNVKCINSGSMVTNLTNNKPALLSGISNIHAIGATGQPSGGSGTNLCLALKKGQDVLFGPGHHTASNTKRFLVVLSDGDNVYNAGEVYQASPASPDPPCQPTNGATSDGDISPNCRNDTQTQEGKVDALSKTEADTLKSQGVEIYIIALSVCGGINTSPLCVPGTIGQTGAAYPDSSADHNLLKCLASSTPGTNDHYYETATASQLPQIFQTIAQNIAFRLIK